jgi:hypothetical protein
LGDATVLRHTPAADVLLRLPLRIAGGTIVGFEARVAVR